MTGTSVLEECDRDKTLWSERAANFSVAEPSNTIFGKGLRQKGSAFLAVHRLPVKKTLYQLELRFSGWNRPIDLEEQANGYPQTDS